MTKNTTKKQKRRKAIYSKGEVNRLVDDLVHPLIKENEILVVVDEIAHGIIEGDIEESIVKFTRYRLPWLVRKLLELALRSDAQA